MTVTKIEATSTELRDTADIRLPAEHEEPGTVRIAVVEGAELIRQGIAAVFQRAHGFAVVSAVAAPEEGPRVIDESGPDVVFFGLDTTRPDQIAALRRTLEQHPWTNIVALIDGRDAATVLGPIAAGVRGVLCHDSPAAALLAAARIVVEGGSAIDPRLARSLFDQLAASPDHEPGAHALAVDAYHLTARETDVLRSLAQGRRNKEIAADLGITVGTVKTHIRQVCRKLGVRDRTSAVIKALAA